MLLEALVELDVRIEKTSWAAESRLVVSIAYVQFFASVYVNGAGLGEGGTDEVMTWWGIRRSGEEGAFGGAAWDGYELPVPIPNVVLRIRIYETPVCSNSKTSAMSTLIIAKLRTQTFESVILRDPFER